MPAYVSLIEEEPLDAERTGPWTKIGYSANPPEWRMNANLKRGNPRTIRVVAAFEYATADQASAAEKDARRAFAHCCHQKEWSHVSWKEVSAWLQAQGATIRLLPPSE